MQCSATTETQRAREPTVFMTYRVECVIYCMCKPGAACLFKLIVRSAAYVTNEPVKMQSGYRVFCKGAGPVEGDDADQAKSPTVQAVKTPLLGYSSWSTKLLSR